MCGISIARVETFNLFEAENTDRKIIIADNNDHEFVHNKNINQQNKGGENSAPMHVNIS
jgi:hypothetical protein